MQIVQLDVESCVHVPSQATEHRDQGRVALAPPARGPKQPPMNKVFLSAIALFASTSVAFAAEDSNLTTKAMKDLPGNNGAGTTAIPTAKPNSGRLSEKQMQGQPGVNSDTTGTTCDA